VSSPPAGPALVSGGAGFIGSHLVDALVTRGDRVVALDDLSTGREENVASAVQHGAELVVGDVADGGSIVRLVGDLRPVTVFHLAAQVDVRRAVREPGFDASVNVLGTIALLEATRRVNGARFVFASTGGAIYGEGASRELPLSEEEECRPDSPYGQSKLAAEGYVDYYRRVHGVPAMSLRLGNVYGPRQDPLGEAGVIAIFCGRIIRDEAPTVYGDGTQTRDYVYVDDVVEALLSAEARLSSAGAAAVGPCNVGTGRETTVLELVERLARIGARTELVPRMEPPREGEIQRIALDCERARAELGWQAHTDLDAGLERTLTSIREEAIAPSRWRTG
jgi:UDP-glucose 4-epimerase